MEHQWELTCREKSFNLVKFLFSQTEKPDRLSVQTAEKQTPFLRWTNEHPIVV